MNVDREGLWFIDYLKAGTESHNEYRMTASMRITHARVNLDHQAGIAIRTESRTNIIPVGTEPLQEFQSDVQPTINASNDLPGEYRILAHDRQCNLWSTQPRDETF